MTHITDCLKKGEFFWTPVATKVFANIKTRMTTTPIRRHLDFSKPFEVSCDAFDIGIGGILSQEGQRIAFFYETPSDAKQYYSTNNKEFYKVVQCFRY